MIIENDFDVDADPDRVFRFLQDPHNVAPCFTGAELTEDLGDDRYKGKVKVKLGPVTAAFTGIAKITEKDPVARVAVLVAEGKDTRGSGTAKATATMRVEPKEDGGGSRVLLRTDLTISGKLAQFGRGIMADVSARMVSDLATRVRERIEAGSDAEAPAAGTAPSGDAAGAAAAGPAGDTAGSATPATAGTDATAKPAEAAAESGAVSSATTEPATDTATAAAATPKAPAAATATPATAARPGSAAEPAGAIKVSTLLKVMVAGVFRRLFARLRGRSTESRKG